MKRLALAILSSWLALLLLGASPVAAQASPEPPYPDEVPLGLELFPGLVAENQGHGAIFGGRAVQSTGGSLVGRIVVSINYTFFPPEGNAPARHTIDPGSSWALEVSDATTGAPVGTLSGGFGPGGTITWNKPPNTGTQDSPAVGEIRATLITTKGTGLYEGHVGNGPLAGRLIHTSALDVLPPPTWSAHWKLNLARTSP